MKRTCDQIGLALVGVGRGAGAKVMLPVAAKVHYSLRQKILKNFKWDICRFFFKINHPPYLDCIVGQYDVLIQMHDPVETKHNG